MTQKEMTLRALKKKRMTVHEMVADLWINSPTKIISELIRDGHPIVKTTVTRTRADGVKKKFVAYGIRKGEKK